MLIIFLLSPLKVNHVVLNNVNGLPLTFGAVKMQSVCLADAVKPEVNLVTCAKSNRTDVEIQV
jgi:hypothetical protein